MDHLRQRTATKATTASSKKKAAGSDLSSTRGSEERNSSVPATGRGQKRGRDFEIEKVGDVSSPSRTSSVISQDSSLVSSPESSRGFPGYPRFVRRNNSRDNRSPLPFKWGSPAPPPKRLRVSPASENGKPVDEDLSSETPTSTPAENSSSLSSLPILVSFVRSIPLLRSPPRASPLSSAAFLALPEEPRGSSSGLSSAPFSPPAEVEPDESNLRRSRRSTKRQVTHEIYGDAILGTKSRSRNDPWGIHRPHTDYPRGKLDNLMHHRLEDPLSTADPDRGRYKAIKDDHLPALPNGSSSKARTLPLCS